MGLMLISISCTKEEPITTNSPTISYKFDINDWVLENSKYTNSDGMVGKLYHSKYNKSDKYFAPTKKYEKSVWSGTYHKRLVEYEPGQWIQVHICDGTPNNCYIDGDGNIVVRVQ